MLYRNPLIRPGYAAVVRRGTCIVFCALVAVALFVTVAAAQASQAQSTPQAQPPPKPPSTGEAGGPTGDLGPMAIPKKKEEAPAPPPPRKTQQEKLPEYTITTDVPL